MRLDVSNRLLRGQLGRSAICFLWVSSDVHTLEDKTDEVINLLDSFIDGMLLDVLHRMIFFVIDLDFT